MQPHCRRDMSTLMNHLAGIFLNNRVLLMDVHVDLDIDAIITLIEANQANTLLGVTILV